MSEHIHSLPESTPSPRRLRLAALIGAAVFGSIVVIGVAVRISDARTLNQWTDEQAIPTVVVTTPEAGNGKAPLELPAQMDAYANAPIYARTSGYLKSWSKDIGAPVKAGDVLGEIDTPDLDQQLLQAQADLASAKANAALAATTAKRWQVLHQTDPDSVSQQSVDQYNGDYAAKQAQANAAQQQAGSRQQRDGSRQAARHYLAAHGVEKSFGARKVVKGVTLYVRRGEAVGLLGPNGAGKTTVFI